MSNTKPSTATAGQEVLADGPAELGRMSRCASVHEITSHHLTQPTNLRQISVFCLWEDRCRLLPCNGTVRKKYRAIMRSWRLHIPLAAQRHVAGTTGAQRSIRRLGGTTAHGQTEHITETHQNAGEDDNDDDDIIFQIATINIHKSPACCVRVACTRGNDKMHDAQTHKHEKRCEQPTARAATSEPLVVYVFYCIASLYTSTSIVLPVANNSDTNTTRNACAVAYEDNNDDWMLNGHYWHLASIVGGVFFDRELPGNYYVHAGVHPPGPHTINCVCGVCNMFIPKRWRLRRWHGAKAMQISIRSAHLGNVSILIVGELLLVVWLCFFCVCVGLVCFCVCKILCIEEYRTDMINVKRNQRTQVR